MKAWGRAPRCQGEGCRPGVDIPGSNRVCGGPALCREPALSIRAELEPGLGVLSPKQEGCEEAGGKQSPSAEEERLDEGW